MAAKGKRFWDVRWVNQDGEMDGYFFKAAAHEANEILEYLKEAQRREPDRIQDLQMMDITETAWSSKDVLAAIEERYTPE